MVQDSAYQGETLHPTHVNPLPCYRPGGKILVYWPEFKAWLDGYRVEDNDLKQKAVKAVKSFI